MQLDGALKWRTGRLLDTDLAEALQVPRRTVQLLSGTPEFQAAMINAGAGNWRKRVIPPEVRVGFAAGVALHQLARLNINDAAQTVAATWDHCERLAQALDYEAKPDEGDSAESKQLDEGVQGFDLLRWRLLAYGARPAGVYEAVFETVEPSVDEYIDIIDEELVYWRRPVVPAHETIATLLALRNQLRDGKMSRDQFEERALAIFDCEAPEQQYILVGGFLNGKLRPGSDMRTSAPKDEYDRKLIASTGLLPATPQKYKSKRSVNISLAARAMKRRACGKPLVVVPHSTRIEGLKSLS